MGSDSDLPIVKKGAETLRRFGVPHETRVISAHRTPELAAEYAKGAPGRGIKVIIAAAGRARRFSPGAGYPWPWNASAPTATRRSTT